MGTHDEELLRRVEKLEEADNKNKKLIKAMCSLYYEIYRLCEVLEKETKNPENQLWAD